MITLSIDTSTPRGAVALLKDDTALGEANFDRSSPGPNLFDAAAKLLSSNGVSTGELGLIAIGLGPGSFTGIRAGIAAAKGLALSKGVPIKGVNSFDALALTALPKIPPDCPQMCILGDARRGEIYVAMYDREGQRLKDCRLATLEMLADEIHNPIWFVSSEIQQFAADLAMMFGGFASLYNQPVFPSAAAVGWLGKHAFRDAGDRGDEILDPIYLRVPQFKTLESRSSS